MNQPSELAQLAYDNSKEAAEIAAKAHADAACALVKLTEHEKACEIRWAEVNRRTATQTKILMAIFTAILGLLFSILSDFSG